MSVVQWYHKYFRLTMDRDKKITDIADTVPLKRLRVVAVTYIGFTKVKLEEIISEARGDDLSTKGEIIRRWMNKGNSFQVSAHWTSAMEVFRKKNQP